MTPAPRWSPFVVACASVLVLVAAGCGSSSTHSTDAAGVGTSDAPTEQPTDPPATSDGSSPAPSSPSAQSSSSQSSSTDAESDPTDAVDPPVVESSMVEQLSWEPEDLGEFTPGSRLSIVTTGDTTTVIYPDTANGFRSMISVDGGPFEPHTVSVNGAGRILGLRATATPTGMLVIFTTDGGTRAPREMKSADGVEWAEVEVSGLDESVDIGSLVSTGRGLLAAGSVRTGANPANPVFAPAMWRSADGVSWEPVALPVVDSEPGAFGAVRALLAADHGVVAAVDDVIMRSSDEGATWTTASVASADGVELQSVDGIVGDDETMVALAAMAADFGRQRMVILRSHDAGRTWEAEPMPDPGPGALGGPTNRIAVAGNGFWIVSGREWDPFGDGDVCYQDLAPCKRGLDIVLLHSRDGVEWAEIDMNGFGPDLVDIVAIIDRPAGVTVAGMTVRGTSQGLRAWTWPTDDVPPVKGPPGTLPPPREPLAEYDTRLTVGTVYRRPLFLHCGIKYLGKFNGKAWALDSASAPINPEIGAGETPPAEWPVAGQTLYGYITLVEPSTIEYSLPSGEVIAEFHPTSAPPELCD